MNEYEKKRAERIENNRKRANELGIDWDERRKQIEEMEFLKKQRKRESSRRKRVFSTGVRSSPRLLEKKRKGTSGGGESDDEDKRIKIYDIANDYKSSRNDYNKEYMKTRKTWDKNVFLEERKKKKEEEGGDKNSTLAAVKRTEITPPRSSGKKNVNPRSSKFVRLNMDENNNGGLKWYNNNNKEKEGDDNGNGGFLLPPGEAVGEMGKQYVVNLLSKKPMHVAFSKLAGCTPFENGHILWLNVEGKEFSNEFFITENENENNAAGGVEKLLCVVWFASEKSSENSTVVQQLMGEEKPQTVMFARNHPQNPYVYLGRLKLINVDLNTRPIPFVWHLVEQNEICLKADVQDIIPGNCLNEIIEKRV